MTDTDQAITQAVITSQTEIDPTQATERLALFDEAGDPIDLSSGSGIDLSVFKATAGNGFALEYDGEPVSLGDGLGFIPFDTVYLAGDASTSTPLVDDTPQTNDYVTVVRSSVDGGVTMTVSKIGLWRCYIAVNLSAPLTVAGRLEIAGQTIELPIGFTGSGPGFKWLDVISSTDAHPEDPQITFQIVTDPADDAITSSSNFAAFVPLSVVSSG